MANLTKEDIRSVIEIIKELYLEDMIPWICGYSGGKDSTAVVQLVWYALQELPKEKLKKTVHVISTDTLVESPVVAIWATESLKKIDFLVDVLSKEEKLIEIGVTTFIYKDVIEDYIENIADKTVKIIEMSRYMRKIPDDLVEVVDKTKELFDEFYVVFTDYTGQEERKVEKERRDKDPILFGAFKNGSNVSDRFYFLGDWVDVDNYRVSNVEINKQSLFDKVRSIFKRK